MALTEVPVRFPYQRILGKFNGFGGQLSGFHYAGLRPLPVTTASQDIFGDDPTSESLEVPICLKPASGAALKLVPGGGVEPPRY
jgi:hypothetical protein